MTQQRMSREERQQWTRERLLEAAATVFGERGYHATSVDAVAEAAGFSKGAVYSNFSGKEDLFLALLDRYFRREVQRWEDLAETLAADAAEGKGEGERFLETITEDRTWILLIIEFVLHALREEGVRHRVAHQLGDFRAAFKAYLARDYARRGEEPVLPLDYLPWAAFALSIGLTMQAFVDPDAFPSETYVLAIERLLGDPDHSSSR